MEKESVAIGIMRYNLLWDSIPFLTVVYIDEAEQNKGHGKKAILHWEREMYSLGYLCVMTSTRADENAQFFYRKIGYKDTGCLLLDIPSIAQPAKLFLLKSFSNLFLA